MRMNRVEIPGKTMLFGEYAVLVGGTAVVYPVPRYLVITERGEQTHNGYTRVIESARALTIPELVLYETEHGMVNLDFDNRDFFARNGDKAPCKLGLGLSSAEAVGVVKLRFKRAGYNVKECCDKIVEHALQAHRFAQNGRGSGADVYCCAYGIPLEYSLKDGRPQMEKLTLNGNDGILPIYLVYTGQPADSRKAIDLFNLWCMRMTAEERHCLHRLVQISDTLAAGWSKGQNAYVFNALDEFCSVMKWISDRAGLNYWTDVHTELDIWARKYGGRAKPVGAGGGDMALVLGRVPIEEICLQTKKYRIDITSGILEKSDISTDDEYSVKTR